MAQDTKESIAMQMEWAGSLLAMFQTLPPPLFRRLMDGYVAWICFWIISTIDIITMIPMNQTR
jgi:hypothetical protein